jgi:hypothetical protein
MNPDISRDTFDRRKHYAQVLLQQGRVTLDADWNEQSAILLHLLRTLARDIFGPHGGIDGEETGFLIDLVRREGKIVDLSISAGRYYVDGILCENEPLRDPNTGTVSEPKIGCTYLTQPDYPLPEGTGLPQQPYLVYLDVWERPIGYLEDPGIREVALGGPDTAARSKVIWQIKTCQGDPADGHWNLQFQPQYRGLLRARVTPTEPSRYRGAENQLYRVEVHTGGWAGEATFKWSRDNGSVCFGVRNLSDGIALLESLGSDRGRGLEVDNWVEVVDEAMVLRGEPCPLAQVAEVLADEPAVRLKPAIDPLPHLPSKPGTPLLLRRWDSGAVAAMEGQGWLALEDGIEIQFAPAPGNERNVYRTGDYWLIPARPATGAIEWPSYSRPPHGICHHYALIAAVHGVAVTSKRHLVSFGR